MRGPPGAARRVSGVPLDCLKSAEINCLNVAKITRGAAVFAIEFLRVSGTIATGAKHDVLAPVAAVLTFLVATRRVK